MLLKTAAVLLALLPYVSPGLRFPAQVQPWAALYAWVLVGLYLVFSRKPLADRADLPLILATVLLAVYVRPENLTDPLLYLRKSLAFGFSLSIYLIAKRLSVRQVTVASTAALGLYLLFSLLQYVANPLYSALIEQLVPIAPQFGGGRGASSLSPEATDFGFTAVYLFVLFMLCSARLSAMRGLALLGMLGSVACVFLSKSGSGIISLVIVLALVAGYWARQANLIGKISLALGVVITALGSYVAYGALAGIRGVQLLILMIATPAELLDTSFVYRVVHNWVGVLGLIESRGLGFGAGSFTVVAPGLYQNFDLGGFFGLSGYYLTAVLETLAMYPAGVVPMLLLEYGLIGVAYVGIVFWAPAHSKVPYRIVVLALLALSWLQSFPVAYPPFWLLLGLCRNPDFGSPEAVDPAQEKEVEILPKGPNPGVLDHHSIAT